MQNRKPLFPIFSNFFSPPPLFDAPPSPFFDFYSLSTLPERPLSQPRLENRNPERQIPTALTRNPRTRSGSGFRSSTTRSFKKFPPLTAAFADARFPTARFPNARFPRRRQKIKKLRSKERSF